MKKKTSLKRLIKELKSSLVLVILALLLALISVACTLYMAIIIGDAIDLLDASKEAFLDKIYLLIIVLAVCVVSTFLMDIIIQNVSYKTVKNLRIKTFRKITAVPVSYIDTHMHGDLLQRVVADIEQVADGLLQAMRQLLCGGFTILFTLIIMFIISWPIALLVLVLTPLSLLTASFIAKRSYKIFKAQAELKGNLLAHVNEMLDGEKTILAYGYQDRSIEKFEEINNELDKIGFKAQFVSALVNPSTRFCNSIVYAAVGISGAIMAITNPAIMTVGKLYIFLSYASSYTKPFNEISGVLTELQNSIASLDRVFEFMDSAEVEVNKGKVIQNPVGEIEIKNLYFSYIKEKPLIENFNFTAHEKQMIAIVGPTGCGKTTLINLLMNFYDPVSGDIYLDGENYRELNISSLRLNIGMVLQDTWLFKGTVLENVKYGSFDKTDEEAIEACMACYADGFIRRLPDGYNTIISDSSGLSVGQKQLLCIARIMLSKPPLLILDEATSNIDTRTEILIQKALAKMMKDRTSFVIAHRLKTIEEADNIIVMKDGHILEVGNHKELLAKKGFYQELYQKQFEKLDTKEA